MVNVPVDVQSMISILPREISETQTILVKFMRKMSYETDYIYETIRPAKVLTAIQFLVTQPLYKEYNIKISNNWSIHHNQEREIFKGNETLNESKFFAKNTVNLDDEWEENKNENE